MSLFIRARRNGSHFVLDLAPDLQYWKHRQASQEITLAQPLNHSASDQFRRVKAKDTVWIVTADSTGTLFLVGRVIVGQVMDDPTAVKRFGKEIYEADFHIEAQAGKEEPPRWSTL